METKELQEILFKYFKTYGVYASLDNDGDKAIDSILLAMQEVAKLSYNNAIRLASENAEAKLKYEEFGDMDAYAIVKRDFILKLLKP